MPALGLPRPFPRMPEGEPASRAEGCSAASPLFSPRRRRLGLPILAAAGALLCVGGHVADTLFAQNGKAPNAGAGDAARPPAPKGGDLIVIRNCRVMLIQHATLAADRAGIVSSIVPEEGDEVTAGAAIATLSDAVPKAAAAVAEKQSENDVEVRYARKAAELADAEHERAVLANQRLSGTIPEIEVKRLRLAADRAALQIEQAEHQRAVTRLQFEQASAELSAFRVTAPFDGVVTRVIRTQGEAVRQGDPILELVRVKRVRVEGEVELPQSIALRAGLPVEVNLEVPGLSKEALDETFPGRLRFIDVTAQPISGRVRVWAEVENVDNRLRAGLAARMKIRLAPAEKGAAP